MDAANAVSVKQKKILKKWLRHCANLEKEYPLVAGVCADYGIDELENVTGELKFEHAEIRSGAQALIGLCRKHLGSSYKEKTRQGKEELMVLAMETFSKADALDRNGRRDTRTRTLFYNAWEFLSVVTSGVEVEESVKEKKRYAMWRAAEISNALRDNREPLPPPQAVEEDESLVRELEEHLGGFPEQELHHAADEWNGTARAGYNSNNWEQTAGGTGTGNKWEEAGAGMDGGQRKNSNGTCLVGIRDYFSGQDVIYCEDASGYQTVSAVVRAVIPGKKSGQQMYDIVTQDGRRLQVSSELLAPDVTCGEEFILEGSGEAVIEEIYGSQWPPRYLVKTGNGFVQASDEDLRYCPMAGPGTIEEAEKEANDNDTNENECEDGTTGNNEAPLPHTAGVKIEEGLSHVPGPEDEVPQRPADSDGTVGVEDSDHVSWHRQDPWSETGQEIASAPEASDTIPQGTNETEVSPASDRFDGETCDYIDSYPLPHGIFDKSGDVRRHISPMHRELGKDQKAERNVHIQPRTQATRYSTDVKDMVDAEKCIKNASSALQFNDVGTAVKYLYEALNLLEIQK